mgnify:CR=1 FL=1
MEKSLEEKLFHKKENGWNAVDTRKKEAIFNFSKDYMNFLNKAKTEREFIKHARKLANENGYKDIIKGEQRKWGYFQKI